jgi:hypothetical protein
MQYTTNGEEMEYSEETVDYDDELFYWKSRAIQLETELTEVLGQYEKMKEMKEQLERHILQTEPKKQKKKRTESKFQKEFNVFLDQKKKDTLFLTNIKNKLIRLEIIKDDDKIPWYIIRDECKRLFEQNKHM